YAAASHTHTASQVTDFSEAVDDRVAVLAVAGTGISITYNDAANTLTFANTQVGLTDGDKGDIIVSGGGTVWTVDAQAITYSKIQNISGTDKLLGRFSAGAGSVEEIFCPAAGRTLLAQTTAAAQCSTIGAVAKAGDTMSGDLTISKSNATLHL